MHRCDGINPGSLACHIHRFGSAASAALFEAFHSTFFVQSLGVERQPEHRLRLALASDKNVIHVWAASLLALPRDAIGCGVHPQRYQCLGEPPLRWP